MKYFKKLVGDRNYLSPRSSQDAETFTKWLNDFQVTDYIDRIDRIVTLEGEKQYLEQVNENSRCFTIVTLDDDKIIGTVSLEEIDRENQSAILGIFIGEADYRNNGYGTEAINMILEYGFHYLNLNSIQLTVYDFNERAKACYRKCGFKEMGRKRDSRFLNGKFRDTIYMDILRKEFDQAEREYVRNKNIR